MRLRFAQDDEYYDVLKQSQEEDGVELWLVKHRQPETMAVVSGDDRWIVPYVYEVFEFLDGEMYNCYPTSERVAMEMLAGRLPLDASNTWRIGDFEDRVHIGWMGTDET